MFSFKPGPRRQFVSSSVHSNNKINLMFRITDTEGNMDRQEFMEFAKKSAVMKVNYN